MSQRLKIKAQKKPVIIKKASRKLSDEVHFFYYHWLVVMLKKSGGNKEKQLPVICENIPSIVVFFITIQASYGAYEATFGRLNRKG
ncbi:MAG: hypothetical protein CVU55_06345 [Deltaproteobacteria bacterium HGW-Deltaproteobacteria-13]|nr:MAG: hypothetical protein CVU55_06345 [Deltaproteobacteria bacterium HGW-Deltaproteobacteria-13]